MRVTFKSRSRSGRVWTAFFDLGSDEDNARAAIVVAWKHNASIVG
jgi:hypothetical protein